MFKSYFLVIPVLFFGILVLLSGRPQARNIVALLLGTLIISTLDYFFICNVFRQYETQHYKNVSGVIIQSALKSRTVLHASASQGLKDQTSYGVAFKYHYEIDGRSFEGTRYRYDSFYWTREWAENLVSDHSVGSRVQVFYNPQNFADAVLAVGLDAKDILIATVLAILNLMVIGLWCLISKRKKQIAHVDLSFYA